MKSAPAAIRALVFSVSLLAAGYCVAEDTPATQPSASTQATVDATKPDLLDSEYSSEAYGISFRVPADVTEIHTPSPGTIVEFDQPKLNWKIMVRQVTLDKSMPLTLHNNQFGKSEDGLLERTIAKFQQDDPGAQVVDAENPQVINVGKVRVGEIFTRFFGGQQQRKLLEEAIFEAPDANYQLYYVLDFISDARPAKATDADNDPTEKQAYDTFCQMVDSVKLLDRVKVVKDQRDRLFETHVLFVNWESDNGQPLKAALIPQQWERIIKNGKDIGYSYAEETLDESLAADPAGGMLRIGVRSRLMPLPSIQWDTATVMHMSLDRKHEHWSNVAKCIGTAKGDVIATLSQFATSDVRTKPVVLQSRDNSAPGVLGQDPKGTTVLRDARTLSVKTNVNRVDLDPFEQELPVFYIPQVVSSMLPRLLPLNQPKGYMFGTFVPTAEQDIGKRQGGGKVMSRYVDVLPIQQVEFNGQKIMAVPINDRIGLSGPVTTTYMSPEGKFLGSSSSYNEGKDADGNPQHTTIIIVPSDAATLERIWSHPDLTAPQEPVTGGVGADVGH